MLLPEIVRKALYKLADVDDRHAHGAFQQLVGGELFQCAVRQKLRGDVDLGKHLTENEEKGIRIPTTVCALSRNDRTGPKERAKQMHIFIM